MRKGRSSADGTPDVEPFTFASLKVCPALAGFLGLACLRVWLQVCLYDSYTLSDAGLVTIASNFSYSAVLLGGALWAIVCKPRIKPRSAVPWIAFVLMTLSSAGLLVAKSLGQTDLLLMASVLAGCSAAFGGGMFAISYSWLDVRAAVFFSFASLGLGSLAGFLLAFLPVATQLCVAMLMPICMVLCQRAALSAVADKPIKAQDLWFDREPAVTPAVLLGGVVLVAFALGVTRGYPSGEPVAMTLGMRALHQLGVVAVSAALLWWCFARGRTLSASLLWALDIVLIASGILLASALPPDAVGFGVAVANLGDTLSCHRVAACPRLRATYVAPPLCRSGTCLVLPNFLSQRGACGHAACDPGAGRRRRSCGCGGVGARGCHGGALVGGGSAQPSAFGQ